MQDPFRSLREELGRLADRDRLRRLVPRRIEGVFLIEPDGRRLLNFGGNDYLGIAAGYSEIVAAESEVSPRRHGRPEARPGGTASSLVCGWGDGHQELAESLAAFEACESAVVFPSGYAACSGTVATLAGEGDLLLSDRLNHASLIDGCRLSRAERQVYPHRDVGFVEATLRDRRARYREAWIVTDGVFSMDGDLAPLRELCDVAERHDAKLIVDEAHGTGVLGEAGRGACELLDVHARVPVRIGTLSKAIASQGGFVVGPRVVCDYLVNRCRTLIYSTSLSPAAVAFAAEALAIVRSEPQRRAHLRRLGRVARQTLRPEVKDPHEAVVPIVSFPIGTDREAVEASSRLADAGFFLPAIRPPTVPEGTARLRISLSAAHDESMLRSLTDAITDLGLGQER